MHAKLAPSFLVVPDGCVSPHPLHCMQALRNRTIDFSGAPDELRNNMTECATLLELAPRLLSVRMMRIVICCSMTTPLRRCRAAPDGAASHLLRRLEAELH